MSAGHWIEKDARWFELQLLYCDLCGKVIPKYLWTVEIDGATKTFCDERCEGLYRSYVMAEDAASGHGAAQGRGQHA